jgi:integrase
MSDTALKKLSFSDAGPVDHWDEKESGLLLRVGKKTKTFYAYLTKSDGKRGMLKIGSFSTAGKGFNYEEARHEFRQLKNSKADRRTGFSSITLQTYLDTQYKTDRKLMGEPVREKSIADIRHYYAHALNTRCRDLSDADVDKFLENFDHLADPTKRKGFYYINALLNTLMYFNRIPEVKLKKRTFDNNIKTSITTYNIKGKRDDIFEFIFDPELGKTHKSSKGFGPETRLIVALTISTGARPGEIIRNWKDSFVLDEEIMKVPASIAKDGKYRDAIIFHDLVVEKVREFIDQHWTHNVEGLMFYNRSTGKVYSQQSYVKIWERIKEKYGFKGRYYSLRHSLGTDIYDETRDIRLVAETLGNSIETASKYYVKETANVRKRLKGKL